MNITRAIQQYQDNATKFNEQFTTITNKVGQHFEQPKEDFTTVLSNSLQSVNSLQEQKNKAIEAFASGQNDNVQDLMIAMQRASTAVQLTTAVRNKVLDIYRELSQMQL